MFIRFVVTKVDEDSHQPQGLFSAAYALLDVGELDRAEWKQLREALDWFKENLPGPHDSFDKRRAIFWFKAGVPECIGRMWDMVHLLREHGYFVEVFKCRRLGNIVFEDAFQVAAYPSARDGRITVQ